MKKGRYYLRSNLTAVFFLLSSLYPISTVLLLQIPFCVVVGWIIGSPMNLDFQMFETATLFMTVLVVAFMLQVCHNLSS